MVQNQLCKRKIENRITEDKPLKKYNKISKLIFMFFTVVSIISYVFAGILFAVYFAVNNPGMILIMLVPLLIFGLFTGIIALLVKLLRKKPLNLFSRRMHNLNVVLIIVGIIALIYSFYN